MGQGDLAPPRDRIDADGASSSNEPARVRFEDAVDSEWVMWMAEGDSVRHEDCVGLPAETDQLGKRSVM